MCLHAYVVWQCTRLVTGEEVALSDGKLIFVQTLLSFLSHTFIVIHSKSLAQQCVGVYQGMYVCIYVQLICKKNVHSCKSDIITEFGIFCVRVRLVVELIHVFIHSSG